MNTTEHPPNNSLLLGIVALIAAIGTIGANSLALGPIATAIANDFSTDVVVVMRAAATYGVGTALAALCLSPLIDKLGTQRVLLTSLICVTLAFALSAVSNNVLVFIASQAMAGLAAGVSLPAIYAYSSQIAPAGKESEVLGRVLVGWTLSLVIGVSLATLIADSIGWRWIYAAFSSLTVVALMILRVANSRSAAKHEEPVHDDAAITTTSKITWPINTLKIKGVSFLLCLCLAFMLAFYGVYGYLGAHVNTALELPVRYNGILAISYGLGFGIAALGDRFIDRFGALRAMPWVMLTISVIYASIAIASNNYVAIVVLAFIWGAANHLGVNLILAGLSAIDARRRGAILGAYSAVTYLASSIGAILFGWIFKAYSFAHLSWLASILLLAAAFAALLRYKKASN